MYICGSNIVLSLSVKIFCCLRRVALNELVLCVFVNVCVCVCMCGQFLLQIVTISLHVHYGMCACFLNEQASFKYVYLWFKRIKYSVVIVGQNSLLPACASYDTCFGCMINCEQEQVPDMLQYPKGIVFFSSKITQRNYIWKVYEWYNLWKERTQNFIHKD